jgi:hypothetical protein
MRVVINHDRCVHADAFATRCLATMIQNPLGQEHYCLAGVVDDGRPELTLILIFEGKRYTKVLHTQAERDNVAAEGWPAFVQPDQIQSPLRYQN